MNESPPQSPSPDSSTQSPDRKGLFHFWRCFWLIFLVVSLAYAWYCFYVPPNHIGWAENYTSAKQQAADSGKPIILFFTGEWCSLCRVMKRQVWADEEVKTLVKSRFIPVEIDVDDPDEAAVMTGYKVGGAPVTIITDPQGNALRWRAGGISKTEFLQLLNEPNSSVEKAL